MMILDNLEQMELMVFVIQFVTKEQKTALDQALLF